jgi:hypothetical protein
MTSRIGSAVAKKVLTKLTSTEGVGATLASLTASDGVVASPLLVASYRVQNVSADVQERAGETPYPAVNLYCERIVNRLGEKFRLFSGTVEMAVELRHSQDRLEGLQAQVETYADAVMRVLDEARGDWGDGMFYGGGYEVQFGQVKRGGKNYLQSAKVSFEIGVSRN